MKSPFICALLCIFFAASPLLARTWTVNTAGTGDAPTIQAGLDSAGAGDTVLVECGTYYEHDIVMKSEVVLTSDTGLPDCVSIDAQGLGRVFYCDGLYWTTTISGFTITGGYAAGDFPEIEGGGAYCSGGTEGAFTRCLFKGNSADGSGGAVAAYSSDPSFTMCTFTENHAAATGGAMKFWQCQCPLLFTCTATRNSAGTSGGAIYCGDSSSPGLTGCTFINNSAGYLGAGLYSTLGSQPQLYRCLIAFNAGSEGVYASLPGDAPSLMCCDIYGNSGGDWVGNIADQDTVYGNISADPLFCDTSGTQLYLETCSPCLEGNHPRGHDCAHYIGAWEGSCGCGEATEPVTWGAIKSLYR
ncbi:MAG: hypothetical protein PVJ42_07050 [bacterium]|jgi:predicted outer membrane repeat protein